MAKINGFYCVEIACWADYGKRRKAWNEDMAGKNGVDVNKREKEMF